MTYEKPALAKRFGEHWGMSWSGVSRAADIPVSKVRAWMLHGAELADEQLLRLHELDRWLDAAAEAGSAEPAYELDRRLVDGYTASGFDLYCNGEADALLRVAAGDDPAAVLDDTFSDWRTRFDTAWEVFDAEDGHKSIRVKDGYRAPRTY